MKINAKPGAAPPPDAAKVPPKTVTAPAAAPAPAAPPVVAAPVAQPKQELAVPQTRAISRPAELPDYIIQANETVAPGFENAANESLSLPLLFLAQPLTPAVLAGKMKGGDVFLNSDPETALFGMGQAASFIPFFHYREWIEWASRESGQGMLDRTKDPNSDLAKRAVQEMRERKRRDPNAPKDPTRTSVVEYHVFFIVFEGEKDPVALPLAKTKHKKGKLLFALARKRGVGVPLFGGKYLMEPILDKNKRGDQYFNFDFKPDGWPSKEEYTTCKQSYEFIREQYKSLMLTYEAPADAEEPEAAEAEEPTGAEAVGY